MMAPMSSARLIRPIVALALVCPLSACVAPPWDTSREAAQTGQRRLHGMVERFRDALDPAEARQRAQDVPVPWLAGRSTTLAREIHLPQALRENVDTTLLFAGGEVDLSVIAQRIQRATGIPVRVKPDALLPAHHFLSRLAGIDDAFIDLPGRMALQAGPAPLARILDGIAAQLGVYWRFRAGHIEFYRIDVRVFRVRALSVAARADVRLGRASSNGAGGFENTSNTALSTGDQDTLASVTARLLPFMTRAGVVAAHAGGGGAIVVTDTVDALDRIGAFLAAENRALTRRVRLIFEEITVDTHDLQTRAIDWEVVYAAGRRVAKWTASGLANDAMVAQASVTGGSLGGTRGIAAALSRYTTVLRHTEIPLSTLNRRPVTHAVRTTFSYVNQIQRSAAGGVPNVGMQAMDAVTSISQKEETVGVFLTVLPDVQDDARVLLSVAYDNTVAQPLKTLAFGNADAPLQVQQITIDGSGTVQQVELRAGRPTLVAGFNRLERSSTNERLAPDVPLMFGGKDDGASTQVTTLIFVTAQIDETQE